MGTVGFDYKATIYSNIIESNLELILFSKLQGRIDTYGFQRKKTKCS